MVKLTFPRLPELTFLIALIILSFHIGFIFGGELIAAGASSVPPAILPGLFVSGEHYATAEFVAVYRYVETLSYAILLVAVLSAIPKLKQKAEETAADQADQSQVNNL
jgi:hypothetical protein